MVCIENTSTYFDDLEEGEIREDIDPSFVVVPWNQEVMVTQDVTTAMEMALSKETVVGEKLCLEKNCVQIRDKKAAKLQQFHKERESSAKDPKENSSTIKINKLCSKRSAELLSLQDRIVREKVCLEFGGRKRLEVRDKKTAKLQRFRKERESSEADHIKDQAENPKEKSLSRQVKDPKENSLTKQVTEVCSKRSTKLLALQDHERKQFNLLRNELEREFKVNCSGKLSTQVFEILDKKFKKHMKAQDRKLIAMLIEARNREGKLQRQWLVKANEGTLEGSFYEIPLPCSGFKMDNFDYGAEMEVLAKEGNCPSDGMHLDAVEDERSSGSAILLDAQVESDHMIAEVSQCNDNALNATYVDPKVICKSPSISTPNSHFGSEEIFEERDEMRCNGIGVSETHEENLNLNANSPQVITPNSILQSDEGTLEERGRTCTNTISNGLAERNMQNPISNTNSQQGTVHSDRIVVSDSTSNALNRQEPQVNPAINSPYTSNMTTITDPSLSTERNVVAETPLANQNEDPFEQSATQSLAPDMDIRTQLLQMVQHNINIDPLQNEATILRKLQKVLSEKHNEKVARVRAEYERELDNTRRKYQRMEAEADAQLNGHRARLNMVYQKVCMQRRLAEEFQQMFYLPSVTGQLPIHGTVGQEQFLRSSQPQFTSNSLVQPSTQPVAQWPATSQFNPNSFVRPSTQPVAQRPSTSQFTPNSLVRPSTQFVVQQPSTSNYGFVPNPLTIPEVIQPRATFPVAPSSWQRPVLPVQSPQYFLNQLALRNSYQARTPIGGSGPMGFNPGAPPFNHMRPTPLSMPRAHMAVTDFGNI